MTPDAQTLRESVLRQTLQVRVTNNTQKIQLSRAFCQTWCHFRWFDKRFVSMSIVVLWNHYILMGTKFHGLMTMDMFLDAWICGFEIISKIIEMDKYLFGILNFLDGPTHEKKTPN